MRKSREFDARDRRYLAAGGAFLLTIAVVLLVLVLHHRSSLNEERSQRKAKARAGLPVSIATVTRSAPYREIEAVAEARPFLSTPIFPRVSGYIKEMRVDKGDRVRPGQVLATIESPETDKSFLAAEADARNKNAIARRARILVGRKLISRQEADQAIANAEMADAVLQTQGVFKSYESVLAPFAGTITARYLDPGALVQNASASQGASQPVLSISYTDVLRIYIFVDQKNAPFVRVGEVAEIEPPYQRGLRLEAKVARTSGELDPKTRTLLTEIDVENPGQRIVSGSFVNVRLRIPIPPELEVPVKALVMKNGKSYVPVIRPDRTVNYVEVRTGENEGENIKIESGLSEGQTVAVDIGATIVEGQKIQPRQMAGQAARSGETRQGKK